MPVSESAREVFVPKNPPASAVRSVSVIFDISVALEQEMNNMNDGVAQILASVEELSAKGQEILASFIFSHRLGSLLESFERHSFNIDLCALANDLVSQPFVGLLAKVA